MRSRVAPHASRRTARAVAAVAVTLLARAAAAQCPAGSTCYFGTDENGSSSTRATNVQSLAARAQFFTRLTGVTTESFEGYAAGTGAPLAIAFPGTGTATLTGNGAVASVTGTGTNGAGRYAVTGTRYFEATSATSGAPTFAISFSDPVSAFGFYGTDIGDFGSQLSLRFTLVGGGFSTWTLPYTATNGTDTGRDGSLLYAGFVGANAFTRVEFLGTSSDDIFGFDDMTIANVSQVLPPTTTPEPGTVALVAGGLVVLAGVVRRRRAIA